MKFPVVFVFLEDVFFVFFCSFVFGGERIRFQVDFFFLGWFLVGKKTLEKICWPNFEEVAWVGVFFCVWFSSLQLSPN